jgi:predicted anti-sigma-YlaC factor YlaD
MRARLAFAVVLVPVLLASGGCSLKRLAVNSVAGMLSSSGSSTVFTGEDDPELVADALPFAMKLYESLLAETPENTALLLATGSMFAMYANAFVQTPAGMLPETEFPQRQEAMARAKRLYLRGRDYCLKALELRHPGLRARLEAGDSAALQEALAKTGAEDVPYLYWTAASWMGAFSAEPFDMEILLTLSRPLALMTRAFQLEEGYGKGAIHEFYISVYGSLPVSLGGSQEKARFHFARAVELAGGLTAGPYVALATSVSIPIQNPAEFRDLLGKALAIDLDSSPENRLVNLLSQRKARWLLKHIEDYFLLEEAP